MAHNFTSHPLETIVLKKRSAKQIRAGLPLPLRILTSPKTTAVLGLTLASLLNPALALAGLRGAGKLLIPKTAKGLIVAGVTVPTAVGVLSQSKKARGIVKSAIDPRESVKRGRKLGKIIEDPSKASDILGIKGLTTKEKLVKGLKAGGIAGGVIAGAVIAKKGIEKFKDLKSKRAVDQLERKAPRELGFTDPRPVGLGGVPVAVPQIKPIEASQPMQMGRPAQNIIQIQVR